MQFKMRMMLLNRIKLVSHLAEDTTAALSLMIMCIFSGNLMMIDHKYEFFNERRS
jgi:hypothetical protein